MRDYRLVFDAVYTPRKTKLLKDADDAGAIIVSGVEMFLRQAMGQFNLFTGGQGNLNFSLQFHIKGFGCNSFPWKMPLHQVDYKVENL